MRPDIHLIAVDLDGTLLNDRKEIPPDFVPMVEALYPRGVRFILASGATLQKDKSLGERWQRGELSPVGFYSISPKHGIRKAPQASSALVLLQVKGGPPPSPPPPSPDRTAQLLTLLSVLTTVGVGAWAIVSLVTEKERRTT